MSDQSAPSGPPDPPGTGDAPEASDSSDGNMSDGDTSGGDTSDGDASTTSVPLDLGEEDDDVVIEQQSVGAEEVEGGGEWPDPATPPSDAAPGSLAPTPPPAPEGHRQFKDAQEADQPFRPLPDA